MWLPRPIYESIPYASIALGALCFAAAFLIEHGPRSLLFGVGSLFATLGLVIWMKRRDYRSTQTNYDPRAIDE